MAGDYPGAVRDLQEALGICQDLGHRPGQAVALAFRGHVLLVTGDYPRAARDLQEALGIFRDIGDRRGQAEALHLLGVDEWLTGNYPGAARDLQEALDICPEPRRPAHPGPTPLPGSEPYGALTGDYPGAAQNLQEALDISRESATRAGSSTPLSTWGRYGD